jgi:diaminohydroxyphosphoribosylaminopyrimidine deaminase/5-amino-6-(5-phosphoribosylamino)uracil reductase
VSRTSDADRLMLLAVAQAERGAGTTSPNPCVGAVVVRDGVVVGAGHTQPVGGAHAEIMAMRAAGERVRGADLYSTLEPCNHAGRTPPCTEAIISAGIARVFVGARDPNPHVPGGGSARLRGAGVEVLENVAGERCEQLHGAFFKFITTGRPRVTLKIASTLDGRIAASSGDSKWVTGEQARARVHQMRARVDAVLVGAGTARHDDPLLTARDVGATRQPMRVVLDGAEPLPPTLRLFTDTSARTVLATVRDRAAPPGVHRVRCEQTPQGRVDLDDLLRQLAELGVTDLLVEAGAQLATSLLEGGHVDALALFLAPRLLGAGVSWLQRAPTASMADALGLGRLQMEVLGDDLLLTATPLVHRTSRPHKKRL